MRLIKPKASDVLTTYLKQCNEPPWTSYFIKVCLSRLIFRLYILNHDDVKNEKKTIILQYRDVDNDQWGKSHFNWTLASGTNYHILRTGCYPYLKYHCSKCKYQDLSLDDNFFRIMKVINLGNNNNSRLFSLYIINRKM